MNWQAWFQIALGALGTANPAIGGLVAMVGNGVMNLTADTAEDKALIAQWQTFCQTIVNANRDPTAEEHQAAVDFATSQHTKVQDS
jgi:hypothetical protein